MALDLRPLTLAELLDRSFSTYKQHVWLFAGIMAIPGALGLASAVLMQFFQYWTGMGEPGAGMMGPNITPEQAIFKVLPALLLAVLFALVYFVAYAFALGATTVAVARIYNEQPVDVAGTYRDVRPQGLRLLGLLIWASLLVVLSSGGIFAIAVVIGAIISVVIPIIGIMVMFLGGFLSVVSSFYFMVRYGVCVPAAVLEDLSPNRALARSVELTADYRGRIFLILLCAIVITYATAALLQGPFMVGAMLAGPGTIAALTLNVIGAILGTAGSMFSAPIMIIGLALAYYDLRVRKEALDLQMMLASLDAPRA